VSADTRSTSHDNPARDDQARPAGSERTGTVAAEQVPSRRADAGRPQQQHQPAQTLNRADHSRARYDAPPIQRNGDSGYREQANPRDPTAGNGGQRRTEHATPGRAAEAAAGGQRPAETLNRADHSRARHDAPPILRDEPAAARPPADAGFRRSEPPDSGGARGGAGAGHDQPQASQAPDAARSELRGEESWPTRQDRDHGRELYQEYLKDMLSGRERGSNVVGEKPDRSPGDTSDLPPSGEELLTMENDDASRLDKARHWLSEEFEDIDDSVKETATDIHEIFQHPPAGHPEVAVPVGPEIGPQTVQHGTVDPGGIAEIVLLGGVLGVAAGHWFWTKVLNREGDHHAGN
jgi:hypothetical protein